MEKAEDKSSWLGAQKHYSVTHAVWDCEAITNPTVKIVALELAHRWPNIFPSIATIAQRCCLKPRSVRYALKQLVEVEIIHVDRRFRKNGGQTSSVYGFVGVAIPSLGKQRGGGGGGHEMPGGSADRAEGGVHQVHPLGVHDVPPMKDPGVTRKLKVVADRRISGSTRRTRATPTAATRFRSLDGWKVSAALRAEWLKVAALPCAEAQALELLERRVQRLRRRAGIGGASGLTDRDGYVRDHFEQWGAWERENLEKAQRRAAAGVPSSERAGGRGVGSPPERSAALKGFPMWVRDEHLQRVRPTGQDLRELAREWARSHHIPPRNLDLSVASQAFDQWLRRRLKAAA